MNAAVLSRMCSDARNARLISAIRMAKASYPCSDRMR
jgi:hypothetical protein